MRHLEAIGSRLSLRLATSVLALAGVFASTQLVDASSRHNSMVTLEQRIPFDDSPESCPPPPDTAEEWAAVADNITGWETGDALFPLPAAEGTNRRFVLTSDHLDLSGRNVEFSHNALISVCGQKAESVLRGGDAIPMPENQWVWPTQSIEDGGKVYVFASVVKSTRKTIGGIAINTGGLDFEVLGYKVFAFSRPQTDAEEPKLLYAVDALSADKPEVGPDGKHHNIQWNASVVKGGDGYTYLYGGKVDDQLYNFGRSAYVARIKEGGLEFGKREYWTSCGWSPNEFDAAAVVDSPEQPGLDASWSTHYHDGLYIMISKRNGAFGEIIKKDGSRVSEISAWISKSPAGPFRYAVLKEIPPFDETRLSYLAYSMQSTLSTGHTLTISLSHNDLKGDMRKNPEHFAPSFHTLNLTEAVKKVSVKRSASATCAR